MARRLYRKKRSTKPRKMRRSKAKNTQVNVNRALRPFAQRYITKMKYADAFFFNNVNGPQTYRYNLNSVFDPNRTGAGHQPYGHDTLATIYNRYRVISCSYVVSFVDTAGNYVQVATLPANEEFSPASLTLSEVRENPRCKFVLQAPNAPMRPVKGKVFIPSLVGRNKAQYMADDRYQAQTGSSPAELAVLNIYFQRQDDSINTMSGPLSITLEYTVEWFDVKNLGQS